MMSVTASQSEEKTDVSGLYVREGVIQQSIRAINWM